MQRQLVQQTIKFFISRLIPSVLLTLINLIYSRYLSLEIYGTYQALWTYLNVCVIFTAFGFPKYILSVRESIEKPFRKRLIYIFLVSLILILIPISVFLIFYQNYFDLPIIVLFVLLLVSQTIYFIQEAILLTKEKSTSILYSNCIYGLLLLLVHFYVLFFIPFQLINCVLGITTVSIVRNIYLLFINKKEYLIEENIVHKKTIDWSLIFWLGLNDGLQTLTKWIDKLILIFVLSSTEFAIYFNGTFELPLIGMLLISFQTIITVFGSKKAGNEKELIQLFNKTSLVMSSLLFPLFCWMFFFSDTIIIVLFSRNYSHAAILFQLSSLMLPIRICSYTVLLQFKNKGKLILMGAIFDLITTLVLMLIFYPILKLNGLVIAVVLGTYLQAIFYLWGIKKEFRIDLKELLPFKSLLARLLICLVVTFFFKVGLMQVESIWINFFLSGIIAFALFFLLAFQSLGVTVIKKLNNL